MIEYKPVLNKGLNPVYNSLTGHWILICLIDDDIPADAMFDLRISLDINSPPNDERPIHVAGLFLSFMLNEKVCMIDLNPCRAMDSDFLASLRTIDHVTVMGRNGTFVFPIEPIDDPDIVENAYICGSDVSDEVYLATFADYFAIEDHAQRHDVIFRVQYPDPDDQDELDDPDDLSLI